MGEPVLHSGFITTHVYFLSSNNHSETYHNAWFVYMTINFMFTFLFLNLI